MTVKELMIKLEAMDENLIVTICDYSDDSDELFHFKEVDGVEEVESYSKHWVSIYVK